MKTMDSKKKARHLYYRKNTSKAAIIKELNISKNTRNKLLREEPQHKREYTRTVQPSPKLVDELGYQAVDKQAGVLLFALFSACYEKNSLLITTSLECK